MPRLASRVLLPPGPVSHSSRRSDGGARPGSIEIRLRSQARRGLSIGPKTIEVALADGGTRVFRGEKVIISTGSRTTVEPVPGLLEASPLTHIEALDLDIILGAPLDCRRWLYRP